MVGSVASSSARDSNAVDRFYSPPMRRQQQKQQQKPDQRRRPKAVAVEAETRVESDSSSSKPSVSSSSPCPSPPPPVGNLDRFLQSTTPLVHAQFLPKRNGRGWRRSEASEMYFTLENLWDSYRRWSAYGAGVPLVLNDNESVIQYYVPYLSGIQLYVDSSSSSLRPRIHGEQGERSHRDASSEGSTVSASDRRFECPDVSGSWRVTERLSKVSLADKTRPNVEGSSSDDGEVQNTPGILVFEYLERNPPYGREPLTNKISILAGQFPELKTYKSSDLLPSSWMSVAWYPIYRIPTGPTLRDLDACFLTFHSLSTSSKRTANGYVEPGSSLFTKESGTDAAAKLSIPIFGLASYKFRGSIWTPNAPSEQDQASLLQAAGDWLQRLQVDHPDFNFFISRNNVYQR